MKIYLKQPGGDEDFCLLDEVISDYKERFQTIQPPPVTPEFVERKIKERKKMKKDK